MRKSRRDDTIIEKRETQTKHKPRRGDIRKTQENEDVSKRSGIWAPEWVALKGQVNSA